MSVAGVDDPLAREEADLVAQVAAGDIDAPMAELYRRYAGRLYRYGMQALGDAGLAEEVVQECFVRLWRTAGRFDPSRGSVAAISGAAPDQPPRPARVSGEAQNVRTGRMIRLRRVAFLLPSALSESLDSSQSPYSAWSVRILRAASRASRDVPRGRYTTR